MLYVSLCLSALLLVVVNAVALRRYPRGVGPASLLSFAAVVPMFCLGSVPLMVNALAVGLTGAACWAFRVRRRWFLISSLAATAVAYGCVGGMFWAREVRVWDRFKAAYPIESLAPRLAYEDRPRRNDHAAAINPDRLSALETQLSEDDDYTTRMRANSLEYLHAGTVAHFVNSPGFGIGRRPFMPSSPKYIELAEERKAALDSPDPLPQPSGPYFPPEPGVVRVGNEPDLGASHQTNLVTFLDPFNFGYARDREHVTGFRPHQFRRSPDAPQRWKVERLELVGLLKYDEPVVYLSENLPAMDELRDAPTRPLDTFESDALAELRRGEDLMVQDHPDRMRVLGSLRAVKQCLRCHHAERGDLLGAFSYKLVREAVKD